MMIADSGIDRIVQRAWDAYRNAQDAVDTLEDIGLAVDGAAGAPNNMSVLFGAMTAAEDVLLAAFGVPDSNPWHDQATMVLQHLDKQERKGAKLPDKARRAFLDISDTAMKSAQLPVGKDCRPYEVTVAMTGGMTVYAGSREDAMEKAAGLPTDLSVRMASWDGISATDAYEA